jgi:hypothetical protein
MLNTVALAGTVTNVEQKGSARKLRITGTKWNGKEKREEACEIAFTTFSRRADELRGGEYVVVQGVVECREYNGKWYTDIIAKDFEVVGAGAPRGDNYDPPARPQKPLPPPSGSADDGFGDIPFLIMLCAMVFV